MRESTFIHKYKERWDDVENETPKTTDELANDFVELMQDTAYAQTHYPESNLTTYLQSLSRRLYKRVFQQYRIPRNPIADFWKRDFPLLLAYRRPVLWFATALFLTFLLIGGLCSYLDPAFIRSVLGDEYVDMTTHNIAEGQPFGVYSSASPLVMFLQILINNLWVGLILFTSGFLLGIGSVYHTFTNGISIGAFFALFFQHGLGLDALFVVMLHGTFELMGLVLECTAGLIIGLSFVFPGVLSRRQAFQRGLTEGARIYVGSVPFTFVAALIESFVTYLGQAGFKGSHPLLLIPLAVLLAASVAIIVWYFYVYPQRLRREFPYHQYLQRLYV